MPVTLRFRYELETSKQSALQITRRRLAAPCMLYSPNVLADEPANKPDWYGSGLLCKTNDQSNSSLQNDFKQGGLRLNLEHSLILKPSNALQLIQFIITSLC
jgi:hypothetical protein